MKYVACIFCAQCMSILLQNMNMLCSKPDDIYAWAVSFVLFVSVAGRTEAGSAASVVGAVWYGGIDST